MMTITAAQLSNSTGANLQRATTWLPSIMEACNEFGINTPARMAAFLAQIGHESCRLLYTKELWGPIPAQVRYEGRADLGNTQPGDGKRFMGRGLIQITGRDNYKAVRDGLRKCCRQEVPDFEACPTQLEQMAWAAMSAAWFWAKHGCNELADNGAFEKITRAINGGLNGYAERCALHKAAQAAIGA